MESIAPGKPQVTVTKLKHRWKPGHGEAVRSRCYRDCEGIGQQHESSRGQKQREQDYGQSAGSAATRPGSLHDRQNVFTRGVLFSFFFLSGRGLGRGIEGGL